MPLQNKGSEERYTPSDL